ncbi:SET domain-containing protein [Suhomyces tanzawaensis NRRL Y-17324]|uniref:Histone-lysine N-methyltransferase SET5 n=1 Tax=Suhomyces tanzawaensis NRRL Y-17324 TaxID=984487 RepID=A0A1E4SS74_9ASCO|nr:SET domain-containing protein [Suhomyces tanzawaensis NRRL Y-17324]ODV82267.1 SET domain-containing protein [Suhomyces tanzawaensis NRRL Y-17324]
MPVLHISHNKRAVQQNETAFELTISLLRKNLDFSTNYSSRSSNMEEVSQKIEVIDINDKSKEEEGPIVPHERQLVDGVIALWKEDSNNENLGMSKLHALLRERHPNWSVSEKRVKTLLKKFGLLQSNQQFTYANEIKSEVTPDIVLPEKVQIVMTSKRGKGLYAKKDIAKGDLIWEETQLFFIPPLANVNLIKLGKACSYCGKLLENTKSTLRGLDCNVCSELWCSLACKKTEANLHGQLKHNVYNPGKKSSKTIDSGAFLELQDYCLTEQWNALYAITIIYANILLDKTGVKGKQFRAMARVSQDIRYKALNSSAGAFDSLQGGALFVQEQQETLWKEGYEKFLRVFPNAASEGIDYREFLFMMGTYNINNLDSCIFLTQSHLNHNCDPNTSVETQQLRTSGLKVFAARDIRSGEELTTTYVNPAHPVQQRQRELRVNWGFTCACTKCKSDLDTQHRRKSSSGQASTRADVRKLLADTSKELGEGSIELGIPEQSGERRKSVRFDEKVVAVEEA